MAYERFTEALASISVGDLFEKPGFRSSRYTRAVKAEVPEHTLGRKLAEVKCLDRQGANVKTPMYKRNDEPARQLAKRLESIFSSNGKLPEEKMNATLELLRTSYLENPGTFKERVLGEGLHQPQTCRDCPFWERGNCSIIQKELTKVLP